jgi:hypothetical protein
LGSVEFVLEIKGATSRVIVLAPMTTAFVEFSLVFVVSSLGEFVVTIVDSSTRFVVEETLVVVALSRYSVTLGLVSSIAPAIIAVSA